MTQRVTTKSALSTGMRIAPAQCSPPVIRIGRSPVVIEAASLEISLTSPRKLLLNYADLRTALSGRALAE